MVDSQIGRMDLDGICPSAGEDENGELKLPEENVLREYFDSKATTVKWGGDLKVFGGRPWQFMQEAVKTMEMIEKMMRFLVEAGFSPEGLSFLSPWTANLEHRNKRPSSASTSANLCNDCSKELSPTKENYVYFRPASDGVNPGFGNCLELPVLAKGHEVTNGPLLPDNVE